MKQQEIARKSELGKTQALSIHLENVALISSALSFFPNTSRLIALLHDLGKHSEEFQNYIINGGKRGSVIHAWQGAFYAYEISKDTSPAARLLAEIAAACITAHHNHLDDGLSPDGNSNYFDKFSNPEHSDYNYNEIKNKISENQKQELLTVFENAKTEILMFLEIAQKIYSTNQSFNFGLGLLVKYLYSCLVDADRLDAYLFDMGKNFAAPINEWDSLIKTFETNISSFPIESEIAKIRKSVSEKCLAAANKETGIYQLLVPTGGGKTLSSLRFALHHSKKFNKKRIIYVIPYLSIIEQTAKSIRKILNLTDESNIILEYHSNIIKPEDETASDVRKLSASRWDSPIIITTMVQFLESVMSSKAGKLRKLASMADSVIIFDEIQALPIKTAHCFNEAVSFLSKVLHSTVLLCSATQPSLEATQRHNLLLNKNPQLIDCNEDFKTIQRVRISPESEMDIPTAVSFILDKSEENKNCLVIVNTKKAAKEIFNLIKSRSLGFEIFHLSTSMYPNHRIRILNDIKTCLDKKTKVICISTQLIEAGVDISFSCVIRAMAGLDSIAQAAGRCNRNGESRSPKTVYTFTLKGENLDKLPDIRKGKEISHQIIRSMAYNTDLLHNDIMAQFYRKYFEVQENLMDYVTTQGETVYAMLAGNEYGQGNYKNRTGRAFPRFMAHAFYSADKSFNVIDNNTKSVVVYNEESQHLIDGYKNQPTGVLTREKVQIIRKLQRYSVSLYDYELRKLSDNWALSWLDEETGITLLSGNYYSKDIGVVLDIIAENLIK